MAFELEPVPPDSISFRTDYLRKSLEQIVREIVDDPTANPDDRNWALNVYAPWYRKHP